MSFYILKYRHVYTQTMYDFKIGKNPLTVNLIVLTLILGTIATATSVVTISNVAAQNVNNTGGNIGLRQQPTTTLIVINHVNNTAGGNVKPSDFRMVVSNLNATKGSLTHRTTERFDFINGSDTGTKLQLMPGLYGITDNHRLSKPLTLGYNSTLSGDCKAYKTKSGAIIAGGAVHAGDSITCTVTRNLISR